MILDQFGRPIEQRALSEPQTANLGQLHQEFAGHPSRGLTPAKLARILAAAEEGDLIAQFDLFDDMQEKDAHIYAEMSKRHRALLGLDWDIVPPRNASAAEAKTAEWAKELLLDTIDMQDLLLDMADAIGKGFAALEIEWTREGKEWLPKCLSHRPQRWFVPDRETRSEIRLRDNSPDGAPLNPFGWLLHVHKAKPGYIARSGLHRVLSWPYLFKNYSVRDLAEFLEIYGLPLRLGKYAPGASKEEKATLLRAVTQIGHAAAGIIPEGMSIDFEAAASGQHDPFQAMMDWAEKSESKAILGGTLTTQADGKSSTNALGNVHNEMRHDLLVADANQMGTTITRDLVYPILALNGRGPDSLRRCPRFVFDTGEPEDLGLYAEAVPKLVSVGVRIPERWAHEKLRIPSPEGDEPILAQAQPIAPLADPAAPSGKAAQDKAAATRQAALRTEDRDEFDELADDMASDWQRVSNPLIAPVLEAAAKAESLDAFKAELPELLQSMDVSALTEALAQGQFAAAIYGRVNGDNQ